MLSEDDVKLVVNEIDRLMSGSQAKLEEIFKAKEKDILTL